ncbi:MAG: mechanosensitive ion channel [Acidimicrobiia bacterium]|nr:mechanosensitive ion channel [Acidimicrobiia bacterium]
MDLGNIVERYGPIVIMSAIVLAGAVAGRIWMNRRLESDQAHVHVRQQLIMIGLALIGAIAIVLALPIPESERNALLGVIGLLVTAVVGLAATTHVGNGLAGIMIRSARRFRPGDFIESGSHFGRVTEIGLFHTEIQTETRDLTVLPNLRLATEPLTVVRSSGTIASATVSLGYEVHHHDVSEALGAAVAEVGLTDPVIQVRELGDFAVTYRVAGILDEPRRLLTARSDLRVAMLDHLHQAGIEIVSPTFMNQRQLQENSSSIPAEPVVPSADRGDVEAQAFDKADLAESVEELSDRLAEIVLRIAEIEDGEQTPEALRRLESLNQSRDVISRVIDERRKSVEEDPRR